MSIGGWTQGILVKVVGIAVMAQLMLIPLGQVNDLIGERQQRRGAAASEIATRWGGAQSVSGAVLVVPVRWHERDGERLVMRERREFVLPDRLDIRTTLLTERRRYGLYETPVYIANLRIEGRFDPADVALLARDGCTPQWARAQLLVPVADVHGIRRVSTLRSGDVERAFGPGRETVGNLATIAVPLELDADGLREPLPFAFELGLAGSERLGLLPLARRTEAVIDGDWPAPGFDGAFLPAERRVETTGFSANWQVLDLNRPLAQHWSESEDIAATLGASAFGVSLIEPAGPYQRNVRAGKYGILFIALTFVAFFLFEVLRGLRVHPVQYLLVGLALATFYVVLLALSEQIGFTPAYVAAACATALLIGGYAASVLAGRRAGWLLGGLVGVIYALLYGLVSSDDYALLMGALALLLTVAALMFLTRRVDWYAMSGPCAQG